MPQNTPPKNTTKNKNRAKRQKHICAADKFFIR